MGNTNSIELQGEKCAILESMISGDASKNLSCPIIARSLEKKTQYLETGKIVSFCLLCLSFLCMSWQIWAFCTFPHIKHMGNFLSASPELNIEMKNGRSGMPIFKKPSSNIMSQPHSSQYLPFFRISIGHFCKIRIIITFNL